MSIQLIDLKKSKFTNNENESKISMHHSIYLTIQIYVNKMLAKNNDNTLQMTNDTSILFIFYDKHYCFHDVKIVFF